MEWPFSDNDNTAAFTSRLILDGLDWIYYVTHDADDGAWQFHPHSGPTPEEDARVVSLKTILEVEPRLAEVADLPLGWHAWRDNEQGKWHRAEQQ